MTRVYGLIGSPVAHSLSPRMHAAWIADTGLDAVYLPFETAPETPGEAIVSAIRTLGLGGVNLTVPFKERVLHLLDSLDSSARRCGAVNTLVAHEGRLIGSNTDAPGFAAAVAEAGVSMRGSKILVLGAGGAARAVAIGAADAGAGAVTLLNRTETRALQVARQLNPLCPDTTITGGALSDFDRLAPDADVIAVAVSRAGLPAIRALDPEAVRPGALWVDLNYWDESPPLFDRLRNRGVRMQDGLPMLIHQGALAFEAFTGRRADPSIARRALPGGIAE